MVLGMLPVSALAADDGVSPQALNTGHEIDVTFTVLYVGDEFNIGYNYGTSEKTQFVCQYSTPHSDTAYNNHTIAISDIKAAAERASVNSGYQIVGWSKEANANPKTWGFDLKDPTACNKGTTIYLVAKNPNPTPTMYTYHLIHEFNYVGGTRWDITATTAAESYQLDVNKGKPTRNGYSFAGWADKANAAAAKYFGGEQITLTKDSPSKTIYAVWMPVFELRYDANGGTGAPASQTYTALSPTSNQVTFTVPDQTPTKADYTFKGWADSATATDAQYQPGGTIAVKHENSPKTVYAVWECNHPKDNDGKCIVPDCNHPDSCCPKKEEPGPGPSIDPPSEDKLLGLYIAKVYCAMPANHGSEDFTYIKGTLDTSRTYTVDENGFCTVYLYVAKYVEAYNGYYTSSSHARRAEDPTTVPVTLVYRTDHWEVAREGDKEALADIPVYCAETPVKPAKPTALDGSFAIVCKNNEATHAHKADYIATPSQYTISDVQTDDQGYYVTATVTVAPNLVAYNTLTGAEHRLVDEQDATLTITFRYDTEVTGDENRKWKQQGEVPVVEVICEPKAPTADDLKKLEMAVQVKCVVDASQQHTEAYDLLGVYDEDYFVGEPRKDGDDWLCDISYVPDLYVAAFNTTFQNLKHVQNDEQIVPVTLIWAGDSWQLKTQGRVHVTEEYTVTFNAYGGFPTPDEQHVKSGEKAVLPVEPTLKGYTFAFWYLGEDEQNATAYDFDTPVTENITLTAKWNINKYTVTFNSYGGTPVPPAQEVEYGLTATEPAAPKKTGYTFDGWYLGDEKYDFSAAVEQNITLTAKWEAKKANVHLMIFKSGDLSTPIVNVPYATDKLAGDTIDLAEIDLSSYLDFDFEIDGGWYDDGLFNLYKKYVNGEQENKPAALTELQINGNWQNLKLIVTELVPVVYYMSDADRVADNRLFATTARVGSALPTANAPTATRDGYTFTFWSREGQLGTDVTGQTVNGWTNLVANWKVTPHNIYAYARLNSYFAPLTTKEFDTPITLNEATLSRLGLGSYNSLGYISIGSFTFDAMPLTSDLYFDDDAELSAVAEKLATDIALETGVSDKIAEKIAWTVLYKTVNEEDMAPGYPAEAGYQLSGNLNLASVTFRAGAENVENMPAVNYTYDDGAIDFYDFYFAGDTFTMPADPTREGYIFEGWSVKVLPAENDADHLDADGADDAADETLLKAGDTYTITAGGVIFTAQWEARTDTPYTVEHYLENLDGSYALDTTEPLKGTTDTTVTAAAKSYDNFTYDSTVPGTVASGNIAGDGSLVLKLFYTRNTYDYTVRHIKQLPDGTYDEANAEVETLSGKFEALAAVTAKDYGSHYPTNDAGTKQNIKIEKNLTIDVKYDLDNHTLTFETNGGSAIAPVTVRHGNAVARPADPTKDKYTFIGWYADPEFTEEYDFATVLEADKTIYAKFELTSTPIGDIYVRYDVLHIKQLPDGSYDLANAEVEHLSAKKDTTVTAVVKNYSATHHINVNSTLSKLTDTAIQPYPGADGKPVYTILSVYYDLDFHTLTFDTMGGSRIDPVTVRHGNAVAKPKDPVNGGYIFDGWYTDKTYRTPYNFATVLTQDTTIYAKWFLIALPGVTIKKTTPKLNTSDHFAYVQGYPDGTVKPTGNITRAETAAILFRLMDEGSRKTYYSTKSGFRDVATGSWYNTYVATLNNAGVITDSSNGYFRPNEAITRAELAAMLANFTETAGAANYFNDVSARYWAANAIAICAKLGWITGYPDGSFRPDRNVTRAELMAMINRATGRAPKSADAFLPGMKTWSDNTADKWYYLDVQEATNSHSYTVKDSEKWTALNADPNWSLYE